MPIAIFSTFQYSLDGICACANDALVGWADPAPTLSRKRPTADLVSRKVLTPLLGHISIVVLAQLAVFKTVQMQPWLVAHDSTQASILTTIQVYATAVGSREEQHCEFREHLAILILLFPVHPHQRHPQRWSTFPKGNDP